MAVARALESTWTLDVELAGVRLHSGDVPALLEIAVIDTLTVAFYFVAGYVAHSLYSKTTSWKVLNKAVAVAVGVALAAPPFALVHVLAPVRSLVTAFVLSYHAVLAFLRWVEFVSGTGPKGFDASRMTFAIYFCVPSEILFEEGKMKWLGNGWTRAAPIWDLAVQNICHLLFFLGINSLGRATGLMPFLAGTASPADMPWYGFPYTLPALYLQTYMVYCMLTLSMLGQRLLGAILGFDTRVVMKQPLFLSTSLREFWGRRWNLLIHHLMKRCFFEPFKGASASRRQLGGVLAFLMSGLFHEYMWLVLHAFSSTASRYVPGKVLVFFLANFVATAAEVMFFKGPLGRLAARMPTPVLTFLVTLSTLPAAPLFMEGVHDMLLSLGVLFPSVEVKGDGVAFRSAALCALSVVPTAITAWRLARSEQAERTPRK